MYLRISGLPDVGLRPVDRDCYCPGASREVISEKLHEVCVRTRFKKVAVIFGYSKTGRSSFDILIEIFELDPSLIDDEMRHHLMVSFTDILSEYLMVPKAMAGSSWCLELRLSSDSCLEVA